MISALIGFVFLFAIIAGFTLVAAFLLDRFTRGLGLVLRSLIAGFLGGFMPIASSILMFVGVDGQSITFITILPVIILGMFLMLIVAFPVAYFFGRSRQRARGAPVDPETFE